MRQIIAEELEPFACCFHRTRSLKLSRLRISLREICRLKA